MSSGNGVDCGQAPLRRRDKSRIRAPNGPPPSDRVAQFFKRHGSVSPAMRALSPDAQAEKMQFRNGFGSFQRCLGRGKALACLGLVAFLLFDK
jgi:hypothetical protein